MPEKTIGVFHGDATLQQYPDPLPAGTAMHLHYWCRHLPTGSTYLRLSYFINRYAFEFCLKTWSRSDTWRYAETEDQVNEPVPDELLVRGIAAHMWHNLPTDNLGMARLEHYRAGQLRFKLEARRCGRMVEGKPVLTGGAEICLCLRRSEYGGLFSHERKIIRLSSGWTEADFKESVRKVYDWHNEALTRMEEAEELWRRVVPLSGRAGFSAALAAREKEVGESKAYSRMKREEIGEWRAWVEQWAKENAPDA